MEFRLLGIKIYVSFLFWAIICFMLCIDRSGLIIPLMLSILIHELSHLCLMKYCGCSIKSIGLIPSSILITRDWSKNKNGEILIAMAGSAANILLGIFVFLLFIFFQKEWFLKFAILNFTIALFNLLPLKGLDGGIILSHLISRASSSPYTGDRVIRIITMFFGVFLFGLGIFLLLWSKTNPSILIVAIYLFISSLLKQ